MPATNAIAAAILKYEALTAANFPSSARPEIYLDQAPLYDGAQVRTPYTVIRDTGMGTAFAFGGRGVETTNFTLTLYYRKRSDADTAASAVKYNGGAVTAGSGFDFGSLAAYLPAGETHLSLVRTGERDLPPEVDYQGQLVHPVELSYRAMVQK